MTLGHASKATAALVAAVLVAGCSRDHIEAINLANAGDQEVKVNVESAIQKYEQATQLDPTNHRILKKLGNAYEKKEDWDKMASTFARAAQVAPEFADYWYARGFALNKIAANNNPDRYEEAKEPLKKCIEKDPNFAECYHELGEASLWTKDEQAALANYSKAIEHNPTIGYFYPPVAELYVNLKYYNEAETILKEGARLVPQVEKNKNYLYAINILLFKVAQAKDDKPGMLVAVEAAEKFVGNEHPEQTFNLGSTYAKMEPPQKEKAVRLLNSFQKRACRSASATKFKEQCETTQSLIQKLGGTVN